jgi:phosphatidylinositol 4-kinase
LWQINPAIAVYMAERLKSPFIRNEIGKLVRSSTLDVLDTPEALAFLLGDKFDPAIPRDLKVRNVPSNTRLYLLNYHQHILLWAPVPPIIANTFFERRYNNDPLLLQYAHRVLEQHPVKLTFFFVPQVVQALRYDELGVSISGYSSIIR